MTLSFAAALAGLSALALPVAALGDVIGRLATRTIVAFSFFAIVFYAFVNVLYFVVHTVAFPKLRSEYRFSSWEPPYNPFESPFLPGIAVIIPAYNEEVVIADSVRSTLALDYIDSDTIVVNDGSTDRTLQVLRDEFDLERIEAPYPLEMPCEHVRNIYRSASSPDLYVIDKDNGGRSDALNAGVWFTDQELFCSIDADTLIDREGLLEVVKPFLRDWDTVVATGGTVRVANGVRVLEGLVSDIEFPSGFLPGIQVLEYLRSFFSGRVGLDYLHSLVLLSGAFGVFKTDVVREIGGYRRTTVGEDLDLVVRIHEYMRDRDREYDVRFVPSPVAWTEVPDTLRGFVHQRTRWCRGLVENLVTHRHMIANPRYGAVGTFALPFFVLAEFLGPLVEGLGYVLLPIAVVLGIIDLDTFLLFALVTTGFGIFLSWYATFGEVWTYRRFRGVRQVVTLLAYGAVENLGYRQFKALIAWIGLVQFLRGDMSWGDIPRRGFER